MHKELVKIKVEQFERTFYVNVQYLPLLGLGAGDAQTHIDKYHAIRREVTRIADFLGTDRVGDDEKKYEFHFTLLSAEKDRLIKKLNEQKNSIIEAVDPEKKLYKIEVVTV